MHVARLFDRKVTLIHGAMALRAEAHLVVERKALEHLEHFVVRFVVERGVNAMTFEDCESDLAECVAELLREIRRAHVARADLKVVVELIVSHRFGKVIRLRLRHLLVADEVLIQRVNAIVLRGHSGRG